MTTARDLSIASLSAIKVSVRKPRFDPVGKLAALRSFREGG